MEQLIINENKICLKIDSIWGGEIIRPLLPEKVEQAKLEYEKYKQQIEDIHKEVEQLNMQIEVANENMKEIEKKLVPFGDVFEVELEAEPESENLDQESPEGENQPKTIENQY